MADVLMRSISQYAPAFWRAFLLTCEVTLGTIIIGSLLGIALALMALQRNSFIRWLSRIFVEIFLALPVLVVLIWIYYCLPLLSRRLLFDGVTVAQIGMGLSLSAFISEIVRGGVNAVPRGHLEVAYCTGLTRWESIRFILLPQAIRKMWPALVVQYITCYKLSTLAAVIAVPELLHTSEIIIAQNYQPLPIYTSLAFIFLITVVPLNYLARRLDKTERFGGVVHV